MKYYLSDYKITYIPKSNPIDLSKHISRKWTCCEEFDSFQDAQIALDIYIRHNGSPIPASHNRTVLTYEKEGNGNLMIIEPVVKQYEMG